MQLSQNQLNTIKNNLSVQTTTVQYLYDILTDIVTAPFIKNVDFIFSTPSPNRHLPDTVQGFRQETNRIALSAQLLLQQLNRHATILCYEALFGKLNYADIFTHLFAVNQSLQTRPIESLSNLPEQALEQFYTLQDCYYLIWLISLI